MAMCAAVFTSIVAITNEDTIIALPCHYFILGVLWSRSRNDRAWYVGMLLTSLCS